MNILIIGSGGREHALAWKLGQSEKAGKIYIAPGNGGTEEEFINVDIGIMETDRLIDFSKENEIDLVVVGPEDPLSLGIVDSFKKAGIPIFGPDKECSKLETSKDLAKKFLNKYGIPTARSYTYTDYKEALAKAKDLTYPLVIKADGLYQGKGVAIVDNYEEGEKIIKEMLLEKSFGESGSKILLEEYLQGEEISLLCFVSANKIIPMESARDYKRAYDGDLGPNTGGVGVYSPSDLINEDLNYNIEKILTKIESGLEEEGYDYYGILFIGLMVENNEAKVLEFNVRFGDPETQVVLPRLEADLVEIMEKTLAGELRKDDLKWSDKKSVAIVMYSDGYPGNYEIGYEIKYDYRPGEDEIIFHNGTKISQGKLLTNGGRVLTAVALDDEIKKAREKAYNVIEQIPCEFLQFRKDIARGKQ